MLKKRISHLLVLTMALAFFAGCSEDDETTGIYDAPSDKYTDIIICYTGADAVKFDNGTLPPGTYSKTDFVVKGEYYVGDGWDSKKEVLSGAVIKLNGTALSESFTLHRELEYKFTASYKDVVSTLTAENTVYAGNSGDAVKFASSNNLDFAYIGSTFGETDFSFDYITEEGKITYRYLYNDPSKLAIEQYDDNFTVYLGPDELHLTKVAGSFLEHRFTADDKVLRCYAVKNAELSDTHSYVQKELTLKTADDAEGFRLSSPKIVSSANAGEPVTIAKNCVVNPLTVKFNQTQNKNMYVYYGKYPVSDSEGNLLEGVTLKIYAKADYDSETKTPLATITKDSNTWNAAAGSYIVDVEFTTGEKTYAAFGKYKTGPEEVPVENRYAVFDVNL